ncbi:MAG: hypothetical protein ABSH02_15235 [Candidatus Sulfotelmatobacter sp.]|jgi:hypothetical protein
MGKTCRILLLFTTAISLAAVNANSQDAPSLGDLARQQRQQKAAPGKDAKPPKVITNEEIPEHTEAASLHRTGTQENAIQGSSNGPKISAEQWRSQIVAQKNQVSSLQNQIDELNESIRFAPANCVANCVGWNERQREKQQHAERMQAQLEEQKKRLDDMQESARKQGYGSSVYDP